jgi:hypothetical protein
MFTSVIIRAAPSMNSRITLVVARDTKTHEVFGAVIAKNFKRKQKS